MHILLNRANYVADLDVGEMRKYNPCQRGSTTDQGAKPNLDGVGAIQTNLEK